MIGPERYSFRALWRHYRNSAAGPKPREVFAADFRDRVVHHLLVAQQERIFGPIFIHDYLGLPQGQAHLAASDRLMTFAR